MAVRADKLCRQDLPVPVPIPIPVPLPAWPGNWSRNAEGAQPGRAPKRLLAVPRGREPGAAPAGSTPGCCRGQGDGDPVEGVNGGLAAVRGGRRGRPERLTEAPTEERGRMEQREGGRDERVGMEREGWRDK